jgi:hypothetical protein
MKRKGRIETTPDKIQLTNYLAHRRKRLGDFKILMQLFAI